MKIGLEDNLKLSFQDSRCFPQRLGMEDEIIHAGHSDGSAGLIQDEARLYGDLPGRAWGADHGALAEAGWRLECVVHSGIIQPPSPVKASFHCLLH